MFPSWKRPGKAAILCGWEGAAFAACPAFRYSQAGNERKNPTQNVPYFHKKSAFDVPAAGRERQKAEIPAAAQTEYRDENGRRFFCKSGFWNT